MEYDGMFDENGDPLTYTEQMALMHNTYVDDEEDFDGKDS
jgi:hypothetical protein